LLPILNLFSAHRHFYSHYISITQYIIQISITTNSPLLILLSFCLSCYLLYFSQLVKELL
jgi:hypothetical protein